MEGRGEGEKEVKRGGGERRGGGGEEDRRAVKIINTVSGGRMSQQR